MKLRNMSRRELLIAVAGSLPLAIAGGPLNELSAAGISSLPGPSASATPPWHGPMHLNLCAPSYYNGFNPVLNWWKTSSEMQAVRKSGATLSGKAIWDAGGYLDPATGEIMKPAPADLKSISAVFFAPPGNYQVAAGCDYSGESWIAEWDGAASGVVDFLTTGGKQTKDGANKIRFTMGTAPGNTQLRLTLSDPSNPPRNIRVYQARYEKNVIAGEKFNPDWIAEIKKFGCLRFMDWQRTNNSIITDFAQLADQSYSRWFTSLSSSSGFGPKGSIHPSLICDLANATGCKIHVCVPVRATDQFVSAFASYIKEHTKTEVTYEFSNECWHFGFTQASYCQTQGTGIWPNDSARFLKWYGFRASQIMKIVRDVYGDATRWRGILNTQTVNADPLKQMLMGVDQWRKSGNSGVAVNQLFKTVCVTGYFGDTQYSRPISSISKSNPAVVYSPGHGYKEGDRLKIFIQKGMTQLDNTVVTIANVTSNSYELAGVNSVAYSAFADGNNYSVKALIFDIMDKSRSLNLSNPTKYSDQYTYFNQQLAQSFLTGTCSEGFTTDESIAKLSSKYWPALKAVAAALGLELSQYEGGCGFVGDVYLTGWGGQQQFTDYLLNLGHSSDIAKVYAAAYSAFITVGGVRPSKYVEGGTTSRFGTWAGIRSWPTVANGNKADLANPVWAEVSKANAVT